MNDSNEKLSFLEMLQSTLWAALGVQKSENRRRDFTRGSWIQFAVMGAGFTVFLVLLNLLVVTVVTS